MLQNLEEPEIEWLEALQVLRSAAAEARASLEAQASPLRLDENSVVGDSAADAADADYDDPGGATERLHRLTTDASAVPEALQVPRSAAAGERASKIARPQATAVPEHSVAAYCDPAADACYALMAKEPLSSDD